ncbi:2OG-Fe(II) oxygenase [uncultured Methylobacterium sp.]|jgi:hypothetical protein|uniref:2OG-Fe(II) oxygenase n=1 Tax=uncultured Methylobacterium sp. TaxID=157278 RepID=UPI002611109A|nr:2OG-Fe(II) oxygenase [uncultured Methylobacterium sp.]
MDHPPKMESGLQVGDRAPEGGGLSDFARGWLPDDIWSGPHFDAMRARFAEHPLRLITIDGGFAEDKLLRIESWCREARYREEYALCDEARQLGDQQGRGVHVNSEAWSAAPEKRRFFRFSSALPPDNPSPGANSYLDFAILMADAGWRRLLEALTGMELGAPSVEIHRLGQGDFIGLHSDARSNRRLGLIAYCHPVWEQDWGGCYRIEDGLGGTFDIMPRFNRMIIFDVAAHRAHRVTPVATSRPRYSLNVWFHAPDAG